MDIKWKDGKGSILNANKDKLIYLDVDTNVKTTIKREEVKKITIDDGLMNVFKDFKNNLALTIVVPKKSRRNAVKIFNEYDKTGTMLKRESSNFLLDLILESSVILGSPFLGIGVILFVILILFSVVVLLFGEIGLILARVLIFGYPIYLIISHILLRIKRKKLKEI